MRFFPVAIPNRKILISNVMFQIGLQHRLSTRSCNGATCPPQREALKFAHVRKAVLCVTHGALHFQKRLGRLIRFSKDAVMRLLDYWVHMCLGNIARNMWGSSLPASAGPLGPPLGCRAAKAAQTLRNMSGW